MTDPAPQVVPIFATPFAVVTVPEAQALNPALAGLFAERATPAHQAAGELPGPHSFRSRDDLLEWPEAPVRRAVGAIVSAIRAVVASISDLSAEQFAALHLQSRAWFTILRPDGSLPATNHPNSSWLGIYCVTAPPPSDTRFDSGMLRLYECRPGTSFVDATQSGLRLPYRAGHCNWRLLPGQMAVFPSALTHEIAVLRARSELVIVTARTRFMTSQPAWMPPW